MPPLVDLVRVVPPNVRELEFFGTYGFECHRLEWHQFALTYWVQSKSGHSYVLARDAIELTGSLDEFRSYAGSPLF